MSTLTFGHGGFQALDPHAPGFIGVEHDHLWWLNDATRIVRQGAWCELDPQHVRHLIEEIQDLDRQLNAALDQRADDPPF